MKKHSKIRIYSFIVIVSLFSFCKGDDSERLSFVKNEQNGMVRFQAFTHGKIKMNENEKYYDFILKQTENIQGVFQIDSTNSELRIRLVRVNFPFDSKTDCTNTNSGNTYSCKIEIKSLEKASYRLRVFRNSKTEESSFNLFAGIFGNGYVHIE